MLASTRTTAAWISSDTMGAAPRRSGSAAGYWFGWYAFYPDAEVYRP